MFYLVLLVKNKHEEKERNRLLNEKLEEANQRLRAYAIEVEQMAETRERNRLAREIHDTLGHALTGISAGLDACIMMIDVAPEVTKQQLNKIRDTARKGITDVRRSVKKLRPDDLERLPFQEALLEMTKNYSESSGMEITFDIFSWSDNLRRDQEDVIYRVLRESITNAKRHGQATKVKITIGGNEKYLLIAIADNGRGCEDVKQVFGLKHMRESLKIILDLNADLKVIGLAENGNKVLELLKRNLPDIILMDIRMPELDGGDTHGYEGRFDSQCGRHYKGRETFQSARADEYRNGA